MLFCPFCGSLFPEKDEYSGIEQGKGHRKEAFTLRGARRTSVEAVSRPRRRLQLNGIALRLVMGCDLRLALTALQLKGAAV